MNTITPVIAFSAEQIHVVSTTNEGVTLRTSAPVININDYLVTTITKEELAVYGIELGGDKIHQAAVMAVVKYLAAKDLAAQFIRCL